MTALIDAPDFNRYSMLVLNEQGQFIQAATSRNGAAVAVRPQELPEYLQRKIALPEGVSDVFVWVHGWQNDLDSANRTARRLFSAIEQVGQESIKQYPRLQSFTPAFVAVHWPSASLPTLRGYKKIRDRAKAMTGQGFAEFFLASLLGYLKSNEGDAGIPQVLQSSSGFRIHCIGHSFGGRFLTAAIGAASTPQSPKTLALIREVPATQQGLLSVDKKPENERFEFTVDSLLVFQMAAPHSSFGSELIRLIETAPLRGPIVLTHSKCDAANCRWHWIAEWFESGIGCKGASQPSAYIDAVTLKSCNDAYKDVIRPGRIANVDASLKYSRRPRFAPEGAHSDIWYRESVHLVLSTVEATR
jgi:hypothetical protein